MKRLLDRVRLFWLSRSPRARALAVLAPFVAEYQAMTGMDMSDRVLGDSVLLSLAAAGFATWTRRRPSAG
jgi:hypothetical protein